MKIAPFALAAGILVIAAANAPVRLPPPEAVQLAEASRALDAGGTDVAGALERLADALRAITPPTLAPDVARIRGAAQQIGREGVTERTHAELVRIALELAVRALRDLPPSTNVKLGSPEWLRLRKATEALAVATGAIDSRMAIEDQDALVRVAIREATRAVFAAAGAPEPQLGPSRR